MHFLDISLIALALYLGIGILFAVGFVARGVGRVDNNALSSSFGFRVLILPGAAMLWPIMLIKWIRV